MNDTIVAVSTTLGVGAISIVRISGDNSINIVKKVFKGQDISKVKTHTIVYGHIIEDDQIIDEVLLMIMLAPRTYTKENTIEINCHGGIATTNSVIKLLLKNGARLAEPGEFTKRAYLNGRINLLEAESVNDLIQAKTEAARTLAINNVDGILTKKIKSIRDKIVKILANIEVNIDYPEYTDEIQVTNELLETKLLEIDKDLQRLVNDSKNGRMIKEGINIAIIGLPNVGKSSILNHLLDEEKAIVTSIPGTTRDIVEGSITLNDIQINFIDTAGIRETADIVEQIGVDKSKKSADVADLVLLVLNNNQEITEEEQELINKYKDKQLIIMVNKDDLDKRLNVDNYNNLTIVYGNTTSPEGLDNLKKAITQKLELDNIVNKDMSYLSNIRQIDLINKAKDAIDQAKQSYLNEMPIDMIEIDIKQAWDILGELIGESYSEELVDNIFANFCLGK